MPTAQLRLPIEALHTFDTDQLRLAPSFRDQLMICRPIGTQTSMDFDLPPEQ